MAEARAVLRLGGPQVPQEQVIVGPNGLSVGRGSANDLVIRQTQISKEHIRLFWQNGDLLVEDLDSTNGTTVNEERLTPHVPFRLQPGDTIHLGKHVLIVEEISAEAAPQTEPGSIPEEMRQLAKDVLEQLLYVPRPSELPEMPRRSSSVVMAERSDDPRYLPGIPRDRSTWLQYLPAIYSDPEFFGQDSGGDFIGRYLLIFESIFAPISWHIDNFDQYLSPKMMPEEWLNWVASWFDILMAPQLSTAQRREIIGHIGELFMKRGTRPGLEKLLELYLGDAPQIIEDSANCHFTVRLSRAKVRPTIPEDVIRQLIESQKPAFTTFTVEVV